MGFSDCETTMKALWLVLLVSCSHAPQLQPVRAASQPVDIVEIAAGATFMAPVPGVFMTDMFFTGMLVGVEVEKRELKVALAKSETIAALTSLQAETATARVVELEQKQSSWWEQSKFAVGVLLGALVTGGVVIGVGSLR